MPVQQHPVPQQISAYEFRLIGDMTLKQFGWLAGGGLVALIFYGLPFPGIIKWPLILLSGFLGFAFAFMPIEERPVSTWLFAFIKAVFSPTLFVWQKKPKTPEVFEPIVHQLDLAKIPVPPPDREQLVEYLRTLPGEEKETPLDQKEKEFFQQITTLFPTTQISQKFQPVLPLSTKKIPPTEKTFEVPKVEEEKIISKPLIKVSKPPIEEILYPNWRSLLIKKPKRPVVKAKTSQTLPIPTPPTIPNIVTGMVLDKNGEIIEGAIVEIRNAQGIPVRALKTNKIGQFTIATPLENGTYEIEIEKEGYNFDIINLEAKGEIIQPLEIRAK